MTPLVMHDLLDRACAHWPEAVAIGHGSTAMSYAELGAASHRIAGELARRGVARGDRVLIMAATSPLLPALIYGCSRLGAVFSILNDRTVAVAHYLDDAEPVLLVTDQRDRVRQAAGERGVAILELGDVRAAVEAGAGEPSRIPGPAPLSVDPVCLIYTSGSTGMPKAVVSTHAQLVFAATAIQSVLEYLPTDVVYSPLPLSFDYGMYQIFLATLAGARLQLGNATDAGPQLCRQLVAHRATVFPAVPTLARALARLLSRPGVQAPQLRLLTNTGAAMRPEALRELRAHIPSLQVQLMFGLTECKRTTIMDKDEDLRRPGACGRALPGTEVFTVDEAGTRLPAGDIGEIVVRGPNVMAGYWRRPELTSQRFPRADGLFPQLRTGDYGWLDEDGYLYFVGRRDDIYKENGTRVSVTEVEAAVHRIPGIDSAAALPPGPEEEGAVLFAVTQLTPPQVLAALCTELDELKAPRECHVIAEIPLTNNGKVDRAALRAMRAEILEGAHA